MWYGLAADAVVLLHLSFVLFVVGGGFLSWRWRWLAWIHAPSAIWGVAIEFGGWICPLTPLENHLRRRSGEAAYVGDFVEHHVLPLLLGSVGCRLLPGVRRPSSNVHSVGVSVDQQDEHSQRDLE